MKKKPRGIVVDASVACSAGTPDLPTSRNCRDFLDAMRDESTCHCVFTSELRDEWTRHATKFSREWLVSMAAKGRYEPLKSTKNESLRRGMKNCAKQIAMHQAEATKAIHEALIKDAHLIEGATTLGNRVVSLDEKVRGHLRSCAQVDANLKQIVWVNPDISNEHACDWVKNGAPLDRYRKLGHQP